MTVVRLFGAGVVVVAAVAACVLPAAPAGALPETAGATTWLCHPAAQGDPCDLPLDTTDLGTGEVSSPAPVAEADKPVDCFYLYPTVSNQVALNQDPVAQPEVRSIATYQAARFSNLCRVFAPVYRQVTLPALPLGLATGVDLTQVGYRDIENAWNEYLATENRGRGVIFISHSQGTLMARRLIREHIDPDPALRSRLVGAFLMGGNVTTARGSTTGGDFARIPVCTRRGEFGCVVAYSVAQQDPLLSLFGNADLSLISLRWGLPLGPGYQVACTDPGALSGDDSPQPVTVPSAPYAFGIISILLGYTTFPAAPPHSESSWTSTAARGRGQCEEHGGYNFYNVEITGPDRMNEIPLFESHLVDINFGYDRLVAIAAEQARTWTAAK
ncbi:lysophospholipase [Nocardia neocaledoniensis NBRC 108232]|uniref:DUF3089 family protein n=1 Tax=Nocardia neocaledoniensis TaxID=236511 RepID=A0A317NUP2_9NOCA|nr:DUF3089 domain-containing protein [Nocardia neocaledoniensis]PWV79030.1 hypothetical protein DFR69_10288 [Nocardia neocaledoniensis]GEM33105.1 lysophospholipase [Nocardia neocaledoniensis NBRC 108232]